MRESYLVPPHLPGGLTEDKEQQGGPDVRCDPSLRESKEAGDEVCLVGTDCSSRGPLRRGVGHVARSGTASRPVVAACGYTDRLGKYTLSEKGVNSVPRSMSESFKHSFVKPETLSGSPSSK